VRLTSRSPDQGINAPESIVAVFNAVSARRLHFRADARVHGIIAHGGDAVNIIRDRASCAWSVRARDRTYRRNIVSIVREVAVAAAQMTGATLDWRETRGYDNMVPSPTVPANCSAHPEPLGLTDVPPAPDERMGSADMGDISQLMPAVDMYPPIAPERTPGRSIHCREASILPRAEEIVVLGAKLLARTAADLLRASDLCGHASAEHNEMVQARTDAGRQGWTN
jgi:metal-dependent amidase/aminoacylase/carboxypeptidase family protein